MKRIMAAVLACFLVCGTAAPLSAYQSDHLTAAYAAELDDYDLASNYIYEELDDGTVTITGYAGHKTDLRIPPYIDGKPVTKLGDQAFCFYYISPAYETQLTSVVIPDTVTWIGDLCFQAQRNLTSITIPENLEHIGKCAFNVTPWLNNQLNNSDLIYLSDIVIEGSNCTGVVTLKEGTKAITDQAFSNSQMTAIYIPSSVTEIGAEAFYKCEDLVIYCEAGSYAETFAQEQGIPCITDGSIPENVYTERKGAPFVVRGNAFVDCNPDGTYSMVQTKENSIVGTDVNISTLDPATNTLTNVKSIVIKDEKYGGAFLGENYNFLLFGNDNDPIVENKENVLHLFKYSKSWEYIDDVYMPASYWIESAYRTIGTVFSDPLIRFSEKDGTLSIKSTHKMRKMDLETSSYSDQADEISILLAFNEETLEYQADYFSKNLGKYAVDFDDYSYLQVAMNSVDTGSDVKYSPQELWLYRDNLAGLKDRLYKRITTYSPEKHNDILYVNYFAKSNGQNCLFWGQGDSPYLSDGTRNPDASSENSKLMMVRVDDEGDMIGDITEVQGIPYTCDMISSNDGRLRFAFADTDDSGNPKVRVCTVMTDQSAKLVYEEFFTDRNAFGDLNADNTVNASDAAIILIAAAAAGSGNDYGLTEAQIAAADVNGDGTVNASDAALVLIYAAYVGSAEEPVSFEEFMKNRG